MASFSLKSNEKLDDYAGVQIIMGCLINWAEKATCK